MLEYPVDEAMQLLCKNLETARSSLHQVEEDLDFLKDQLTTIEVGILSPSCLLPWLRSSLEDVYCFGFYLNHCLGMARVYNWDVKERRKKKGTSQ